jgi:hypothetical protein
MKRNLKFKIAFFLIAIAVLSATEKVEAQFGYPHHPLCGGSGHGGGSSCWSYATSRAFGRTWNDSRCPASTYNGANTINLDFFYYYPLQYTDVQPGDIIGWGIGNVPDHVCYVRSVSAPDPNNIGVAQVENENATVEEPNLTLSNVINGTGGAHARGYPTMRFRKRPRWNIKIQNSFSGGTVGVGPDATEGSF